MESYNEKLSGAFSEIADLMGILGENTFKIRAYRAAAQRLPEMPAITRKTEKPALLKLPGIGPALAEKIRQYIDHGKIDYLEYLHGQIPKPVRDMLQIPHLGPKRIQQLFLQLGIKNKRGLLKAAKNGSMAAIPGFGEKLVAGILAALASGQQKKKRHPRKTVEPVIQKLRMVFKTCREIKKVEFAGSYRRQKKAVGDVDVLVVGPKNLAKKIPPLIRGAFADVTFLAEGETKAAFVIFPQNLQVDIRFVPKESYGAALMYFTGSKENNRRMRRVAIGQGYLLNEYGLFKNGEYVAGATEKEIYNTLGLPYQQPEKRG